MEEKTFKSVFEKLLSERITDELRESFGSYIQKSGKKIYITGKGRCNITNASDIQNHFSNIMRNPKFLYSAYNCLNSEDVCRMIESTGIETKIERGNRVFPKSEKSRCKPSFYGYAVRC